MNFKLIHAVVFIEALIFLSAGQVHFGHGVQGLEHHRAAIAETTIGLVLLLGHAVMYRLPRLTRRVSFGVQAFALLGTLTGLTMIGAGVGPQTMADLVFHAFLLLVLAWGLTLSFRTRPSVAAVGGLGI